MAANDADEDDEDDRDAPDDGGRIFIKCCGGHWANEFADAMIPLRMQMRIKTRRFTLNNILLLVNIVREMK